MTNFVEQNKPSSMEIEWMDGRNTELYKMEENPMVFPSRWIYAEVAAWIRAAPRADSRGVNMFVCWGIPSSKLSSRSSTSYVRSEPSTDLTRYMSLHIPFRNPERGRRAEVPETLISSLSIYASRSEVSAGIEEKQIP